MARFDAAFDAALGSARRTLRLDQLRGVSRVWRHQALLAERDPDHRQMLAAAAEVTARGRRGPGSVSWDELKTELGR